MEDKEADPNNAVVDLQSPPATWPKTPHHHPNKGKKRRNVSPLRVALFLFRRHASAGNKDPLHAQVVKPAGGRGFWKTLLAAMHLLQHHHHHNAPELLHPAKVAPAPASTELLVIGDAGEPFVSAPPSPTLSDGGKSRYASTNDLQELDSTGASNDEEEGDEDYTIDARAEEFIAKFYEQIRLQQLQSTNGD